VRDAVEVLGNIGINDIGVPTIEGIADIIDSIVS
jgi:hypothetical protein